MSAIDRARASLARALPKLLRAGLRADYDLELRRYVDEGGGDPLSMKPADHQRGEPLRHVVTAPKVYPASAALVAHGGGIVTAGDFIVELVRDEATEAFLSARHDDALATDGGPYPEIGRVEFWINGEPFRAVASFPKALTSRFVVRKQAEGG